MGFSYFNCIQTFARVHNMKTGYFVSRICSTFGVMEGVCKYLLDLAILRNPSG